MNVEQTMCPILTAAQIIAAGVQGYGDCRYEPCHPDNCMFAVRATAKGEDGRYHVVGRKCVLAVGTDRYADIDLGRDTDGGE